MKKFFSLALLAVIGFTILSPSDAYAAEISRNGISGRSVVAGLLSFIVWPGIGQAVNAQPGDKVVTHAVIGLLPPFRFWSGYDGLVDRQGGYWNGKI